MSQSGIPLVSGIGRFINKPSLLGLAGLYTGGSIYSAGAGQEVHEALQKPQIPTAGAPPVMPNANNQNANMQSAEAQAANRQGRASTLHSEGSILSTGQPNTFSAARSLLGA